MFTLTIQDINGLAALVSGVPVDEGVGGVRTLSGEGNNIANPDFGAADTPYLRITPAHYGAPDAFGNLAVNPIYAGLDPRAISNLIGAQEPNLAVAANGANLLFSAFGQYVDHGLTSLLKGGNGQIEIGGPGVGRAPGSDNPADLARATVIGTDASGVPLHLNKTPAYVEQNQAYGPNSLVGIFLREPDGNGGITANLASGGPDPSSPGFSLLPTLRELILMHWENDTRFADGAVDTSFRNYYAGLVDAGGAIDALLMRGLYTDFMGTGQPLLTDMNPFISPLDHIVAGDGRVNENVTLTAVHTIWARNHNFHVENLTAAGFVGTTEALFQAAKIINEAEYQRIVFTEFTDVLLGGMRGSGSHGWRDYMPNVDPGISHEFAAAAYRFGHSLVPQTVQVLDAEGGVVDIALFDAFLNPTSDGQFQFNGAPVSLQQLAAMGYVPQPGYTELGVSSILGGIARQPAEEVDANIVDAIRNDLSRVSADLFAFNVARGRDVGLGTLNQTRLALQNSQDRYVSEAVDRWAGDLTPYASWEDFQARNNLSDSVIAEFKAAYPDLILSTQEEIEAFQAANPDIVLVDGTTVKGIDRVDLWVGGLSEAHIRGGMVGQTFWVILHEQFDRLQEADRFYYLNRLDDFPFYDLIDGGSEEGFGAIIARNTGFTFVPGNVFLTADGQNLLFPNGEVPAPINGDPLDTPAAIADEQVIRGTPGNDTLVGASGNDTLEGKAGNDSIDGGEGTDLALFSGSMADYRFGVVGADRLLVTGPDGADALVSIEWLQFGTEAPIRLDDVIDMFEMDDVFTVFRAGDNCFVLPDRYDGPVGRLQYSFLGSDDNENVVAGRFSSFVNLLGGDDAAVGSDGDDVLDGGTGSNFLLGGRGLDVFFIDGRGGSATWSTIGDWGAGDQTTLWGWQTGVSTGIWVGSDGAPGYEGATYHADLDGDGDFDASITWAGVALDALPVPQVVAIGDNTGLWFG